ncbi:MAG: hypothetical protein ABFS32_19540, partial [Bacteroidota bacterium]
MKQFINNKTIGLGIIFVGLFIYFPSNAQYWSLLEPGDLQLEAPVENIAVSPTGDKIAISQKSKIYVYSYPEMKLRSDWRTLTSVSSLRFSTNGQFLYSRHDKDRFAKVRSSYNPRDSTRMWNLDNSPASIDIKLPSPFGFVKSADTLNNWAVMHMSGFRRLDPPYNTEFCTESYLIKYANNATEKSLKLPSCAVSNLSTSNSKQFFIGHHDGLITSWNTDSLTMNWQVKVSNNPVKMESLLGDSLLLLSYSSSYEDTISGIEMLSAKNGQPVFTMNTADWDYTAHGENITAVLYDQVHKWIITIYDDFNLAIIDPETSEVIISDHRIPGISRMYDIALLPNGHLLLCGDPFESDRKPSYLLEIDLEMELLANKRYFEQTSLLSADTSSTIVPQMQFGHPGSSSSLDEAIVGVSADNRFLLSKENSQLILWDAHSLRLLKRFKFKDEIKTASFTENGLIVVSETASTPFIMEYNFETSEITELAV